MISGRCYEESLIIVHGNLCHFIFLRLPHPIDINQAFNMVFLSSMTCTLVGKIGIFVANQEPYSSRALSPKNIFLMHELIDFSPCLVNAFHINSIVGINQLLQLLLFGVQAIPRISKGSPTPLHKIHLAFLNLFEETKHWAPNQVGLGPQTSYLIFTFLVGHPLFLKPLNSPSPMP